MSNVYKNIEKYRKIRGIDKKYFYDLIGMSDVGYKSMEKNDSIKLSKLIFIAAKLRVTLTDLLEQEIKDSLDYILEDAPRSKMDRAVSPDAPPIMLDAKSIDEVINLDIPQSQRFELLKSKILTLQFEREFYQNMAEQRKNLIDKFEIPGT